jgi:hypothetical protein
MRRTLLHLAWSGIVLVVAGGAIVAELSAPCPPGGPLSFGACVAVRPVSVPVVGLGSLLYVAALSVVLAWAGRLRSRGVTDSRAVRDWYLLAATIGLPISILLAFTLVFALR